MESVFRFSADSLPVRDSGDEGVRRFYPQILVFRGVDGRREAKAKQLASL